VRHAWAEWITWEGAIASPPMTEAAMTSLIGDNMESSLGRWCDATRYGEHPS
jgi:hypothetical protein